MLKEFREFAMRGNVVDMAVGIVIGGSFGKIATSLVNDIIMPPIGLMLGKVDFTNLFVALDSKAYKSLAVAKAAGAPTLNYGAFINNVLDFVIVAFAMFLIVTQYQKLQDRIGGPKAAPTTTKCTYCLMEIPIGAKRCAHCTSELKAAA
jgi:large conductance mechanosensitive channel